MAEPFLGEVRAFPINFVPKGWAACDGQILPINQNQALYSLLGTVYGGDGRTTFALPNLKGRVPIHKGNGVTLGESAGESTHTLTTNEMPQHNHMVFASTNNPETANPQNQVWASPSVPSYAQLSGTAVNMNVNALAHTGGSQAHNNMQPYEAMQYCIALTGIFPSRS